MTGHKIIIGLKEAVEFAKGNEAGSRKSKPIDWDKFLANAKHSEESHQIRLFAWAAEPEVRIKYPELRWMTHIPNGGSRNKIEAGKLKAMGVKSGVPDIFLPVRRGDWSGLWIEMKRPGMIDKKAGEVSKEQAEWINFLRGQDYICSVGFGWEDARDYIMCYLEMEQHVDSFCKNT